MTTLRPKTGFWTFTVNSAKESVHLYFEPVSRLMFWLQGRQVERKLEHVRMVLLEVSVRGEWVFTSTFQTISRLAGRPLEDPWIATEDPWIATEDRNFSLFRAIFEQRQSRTPSLLGKRMWPEWQQLQKLELQLEQGRNLPSVERKRLLERSLAQLSAMEQSLENQLRERKRVEQQQMEGIVQWWHISRKGTTLERLLERLPVIEQQVEIDRMERMERLRQEGWVKQEGWVPTGLRRGLRLQLRHFVLEFARRLR